MMSIHPRAAFVLALMLVLVAAPGFAHKKHQRGDALYYADSLKGGAMACGGTYDPAKKTAAHRTLPCGSIIKIRNLSNDMRVTVTITDRGPYNADAILDVSRKAAKRLGFWGQGRTKVRTSVISIPKD